MIRRFISILIRRKKRRTQIKELTEFVENAKKEIDQLPSNIVKNKILLIVRTDEIGDYILSRNTLPIIRNSDKYRHHKIVFVGNKNYQPLAETLDTDFIDEFIWVDKSAFKKNKDYRVNLFSQIRKLAPSEAIELQRTTDIEFGDLIMYSSDATLRYGNENYYQEENLNNLSASFYTNLYKRNRELIHEFEYNQIYVNWVCNTQVKFDRPIIDSNKLLNIAIPSDYILCVIGSSKKSKNWPISNWITLIKEMQATTIKFEKIILLGGNLEKEKAENILKNVNTENIISLVGQTSLMEALTIINNAKLMISNDTFAIHARVAFGNKPTIVMANGESAFRFSELGTFSPNYKVVYPKRYSDKLPKMQIMDHWNYHVPSIDMQSISVKEVLDIILSFYI